MRGLSASSCLMRAASDCTSRFGIALGRQRDDAADGLAEQIGQHQQRLAHADVDRDDRAARVSM